MLRSEFSGGPGDDFLRLFKGGAPRREARVRMQFGKFNGTEKNDKILIEYFRNPRTTLLNNIFFEDVHRMHDIRMLGFKPRYVRCNVCREQCFAPHDLVHVIDVSARRFVEFLLESAQTVAVDISSHSDYLTIFIFIFR